MYTDNGENSIVHRVQQMVEEAMKIGVSDIHLEPQEDFLRVRYRLDGVLHNRHAFDKSIMHQIVSSIKVWGNLDTAEKRIPQDGKALVRYEGKTIDLRIATFPTLYGEKIVIRILDGRTHLLTINDLGLSATVKKEITEILAHTSGFFLATGPTGSGKTTTLYVMLSMINTIEKNIVTLEDPVEYSINGITQGYINVAAGFTFEKGIRALLRQDPEILMVGEIRDQQTARIAIEASLTGHLVLSTLHTTDTISTIVRLSQMKIEPFLISASLSGILAQRLVRKICEVCKVIRETTSSERNMILAASGVALNSVADSFGCDLCVDGYKGRLGIFEFLKITEAIRSSIDNHVDKEVIYQQATTEGMVPLLLDGIEKVATYQTTLKELQRVLYICSA